MANKIFSIENNINVKYNLSNPNLISNNNYFSKFSYGNKLSNFYIKLSKCYIKNILTESNFNKNSKNNCELIFTIDNHNIINFFEKIENFIINEVNNNKELWFYNSNELSIDDIQDLFIPFIKPYRSGKQFIIKFNYNPSTIKIYNEDEINISIKDFDNSSAIIPLIHINGIKFSSKNFILDLNIIQILVLNNDNNLIPENFLIKTLNSKNNNTNNENINDENTNNQHTNDENTNDEHTNDENTNNQHTNDENTNNQHTNDENTNNEDTNNEDANNEDTNNEDTNNENINNEDTKNEDTKNEDTKNEDTHNEDTDNEDTHNEYTNNEDTKNNDTKIHDTKNEHTDNENTKNEHIKNDDLNNEYTDNDDISNDNINNNINNNNNNINNNNNNINNNNNDLEKNELFEITDINNDFLKKNETLQIKPRETIYLEIYKKARKRAKEIRNNAITAFLEAKKIKIKYNLEELINSDSSDDENN